MGRLIIKLTATQDTALRIFRQIKTCFTEQIESGVVKIGHTEKDWTNVWFEIEFDTDACIPIFIPVYVGNRKSDFYYKGPINIHFRYEGDNKDKFVIHYGQYLLRSICGTDGYRDKNILMNIGTNHIYDVSEENNENVIVIFMDSFAKYVAEFYPLMKFSNESFWDLLSGFKSCINLEDKI